MDIDMVARQTGIANMRKLLKNLDDLLAQVEDNKITYQQIDPERKLALRQMEQVVKLMSIEFFLRADYENYLRYQRSVSPGTIRGYLGYISEFANSMRKDLTEVDEKDFTCFVISLEKRGMSKPGIANYTTALRSYYGWLSYKTQKKEIMAFSYFLQKIVKANKHRGDIITVLPTPNEIIRLRRAFDVYKATFSMAKCPFKYKKAIKEIAALEMLITTGVRSEELRNLRFCEIDMENKLIFIRKSKTGDQRRSLFGETAYNALIDYFTTHSFKKEDSIFPYPQGNCLNHMIHRWAKRAGINEKLHAHSFRHFFITEAQKQGVPAAAVARQVGHSNVNTTLYYTHFDMDSLKNKFKECKI